MMPHYPPSKFLNIIDAILDRHAPYMKPSINKKFNTSKPWITLGILTSINKKNFLYKKFIKTKNLTKKSNLYATFKTYRNLISQLTRKSKITHYKTFFSENKNNLKTAWRGINSLINSGKQTQEVPSSMLLNNKMTTDRLDISECFNDFFGSIAQKTKS